MYHTINSMYTFLKINAVSIPSQISGKQHGVLGICLKDEIYNNLTGEDFTNLQNPGTLLTIISPYHRIKNPLTPPSLIRRQQ